MITRTLKLIARLLATYGLTQYASDVEDLTLKHDSAEFWSQLSGTDFWGGSGAVWEVGHFRYHRPDAPNADADFAEFLRLMIVVTEELIERGFGNDRIHSIADDFRDRLKAR